jgi:hypothetical protein
VLCAGVLRVVVPAAPDPPEEGEEEEQQEQEREAAAQQPQPQPEPEPEPDAVLIPKAFEVGMREEQQPPPPSVVQPSLQTVQTRAQALGQREAAMERAERSPRTEVELEKLREDLEAMEARR